MCIALLQESMRLGAVTQQYLECGSVLVLLDNSGSSAGQCWAVLAAVLICIGQGMGVGGGAITAEATCWLRARDTSGVIACQPMSIFICQPGLLVVRPDVWVVRSDKAVR